MPDSPLHVASEHPHVARLPGSRTHPPERRRLGASDAGSDTQFTRSYGREPQEPRILARSEEEAHATALRPTCACVGHPCRLFAKSAPNLATRCRTNSVASSWCGAHTPPAKRRSNAAHANTHLTESVMVHNKCRRSHRALRITPTTRETHGQAIQPGRCGWTARLDGEARL
jgi:hypothetical protein